MFYSSNLVIGIVIGIQSLATLLTRKRAGHIADTRDVKPGVLFGTITVVATAAVYIAAVLVSSSYIISISLMILGRVLLGAAESLQITGALSWGIGLAGHQRSGKVMSWNGIAMYGGLAAGVPVGYCCSSTGERQWHLRLLWP